MTRGEEESITHRGLKAKLCSCHGLHQTNGRREPSTMA